MIGVLGKSLENLTHYAGKYERYRDLSDTALKVLAVFKHEPERELQTRKLLEQTGLARRTLVHALYALTNADFIGRSGRGAGSRYRLRF
jgi:DNA-binding IclR family transcriptional regulator